MANTNWAEVEALAMVMGLVGAFFAWMGRMAYLTLKAFVGMQASLHKLVSNDLPHIYDEIKELRREFMEGRRDG